jgi:hypothetical protein
VGRKTRDYERDLWSLFWAYSKSSDFGDLRAYLLQRSGLPGPRGNLELATAFANVLQRGATAGVLNPRDMISLCQSLAQIPASLAPTNDPKEFLVFCGVFGLGALSFRAEDHSIVASSLKSMSADSRWRTREAVAMALQRMLDVEPKQTLLLLFKWAKEDDPFLLRAVVAGIAEPRLLDGGMASSALRLHQGIFEKLAGLNRKDEGYKVLKKSLGYSFSVVVAALPKEGFAYMVKLAQSQDSDVTSIVRENLTKKRLSKYSDDIEAVHRALSFR